MQFSEILEEYERSSIYYCNEIDIHALIREVRPYDKLLGIGFQEIVNNCENIYYITIDGWKEHYEGTIVNLKT